MLLKEEGELPKSIEELEEEIKELEVAEITAEEKPKKKEKVPAIREETAKRFRVSSLIAGFVVMLVYQIILASALGIAGDLLDSIKSVLAIQILIPNVAVASVTGSDIFLGISGGLTNIASIYYEYVSALLADKIGMNGYVGLLLVGSLPCILAGFIAGMINRDAGYGFIAGFVVWVIALIIGITTLVLGGPNLGIDLIDAALQSISSGWLSALFLAVFGALGGSARK